MCTGAAVPLAETLSLSLTHSLSLHLSLDRSCRRSLAPPADMSNNTDLKAEYAVCVLRPSIPAISDGPGRETSQSTDKI